MDDNDENDDDDNDDNNIDDNNNDDDDDGLSNRNTSYFFHSLNPLFLQHCPPQYVILNPEEYCDQLVSSNI